MMAETITRGFASDNNSGVHPDVMEQIARVNRGHVVGYGGDRYTVQAIEMLREQLGNEAEIYFVFTGTAANVLGLAGATRSWNSVITAYTCLLYTSDAADEEDSVDLGGRRIIKKKK